MQKTLKIALLFFFLTLGSFCYAQNISEKIFPKETITNTTPLPNLGKNEVFTAGYFEITVLERSGTNGIFSGKGYMIVPYLADTKIAVEFNNIKINSSYQMYDGFVFTTYDKTWGNVVDVQPLVDAVGELAKTHPTTDPILEEIFGSQTGVDTIDTTEGTGETDTNTENTSTNTGDTSNGTTTTSNDTDGTTTDNNSTTVADSGNTGGDTTSTSGNTNSTGTNTSGNDYYLEYKGQKYYTEGKIKIPYRRSMNETFEMKTLPDDAKVGYTIHKPGEQVIYRDYGGYDRKQFLPIEDPAVTNLLKMDLQSEATSVDGKPKVRVEIEKVVTPFVSSNFTVKQKSNPLRLAKTGETLYFVDKPLTPDTRNIVAEVTTNPNLAQKNIPKEYLKWSVADKDLSNYTGQKTIGDDEIVQISDKTPTFAVTSTAGFTTLGSKTANVKWVDEGIVKIDVAKKLGPILKIFDEINYWQNKFKTFGIPCKVAVLENFERAIQKGNFSLSYENKNEEDTKSRYYNKVDEFKFSASGAEMFNLSCGKEVEISIPFTDKKIPIVSANFGVSAGLKGSIKVIKEKQIETNKTSYNKSKVSGGGYVTPFISASIVGVQGKVDMETGIQFEYPYKSNITQVGVIFYPLILQEKLRLVKMLVFLLLNPLLMNYLDWILIKDFLYL